MSRTFEIETNPYDDKKVLYRSKTATFEPGITVLVGCNGSGKTTMINTIHSLCKKQNIPVIKFNNLIEGGGNSRQRWLNDGNSDFLCTSAISSEGENIVLNMNEQASRTGYFVKYGVDPSKKARLERVLHESIVGKKADNKDNKTELINERWVLFDAIDSGLSVDNIVEIKESLFKIMMKNTFGNDVYCLVVANEYEMCNGEQCFDVRNCKYVTFKDYEDYRKFILKSREIKDRRLNITKET